MTVAAGLDPSITSRILREGYGPGAWHGPDLKAALVGVSPRTALWRPNAGRHNIAEVALHHAWCVRSVITRLGGNGAEPFPLEGEDWFAVPDERRLGWPAMVKLVDEYQARLAATVADIGAGRVRCPLPEAERLDLVLGITCHAIYHAGQIQLLKALQTQAV